MPETREGEIYPSYSEVAASSLWIELNPRPKKDDECNLCGQQLKEVKGKDTEAKMRYCSSCKTVKQVFEDNSVRIVIE